MLAMRTQAFASTKSLGLTPKLGELHMGQKHDRPTKSPAPLPLTSRSPAQTFVMYCT